MKKIYVFLCVAVALFLGSCSDLSMDNEEALKADLPSDFKWREYAEINGDVAKSQIVLDLKEKGRGADSIKNCVNVLYDIGFAREVYLNYLKCPEQSWDKNDRCGGIYGNNSNYSKATTKWNEEAQKLDTISWQCVIGTCWSGGWSEMEEFLQDSLDVYLETSKTGLGAIKTMCQFIPENTTPADAKSYLESFPYDSTLIEQHYHFFGRYDGRPYKYCNGHSGEKTLGLADKRGTYYDYSKYTFCLEKTDEKIYIAQ